MKKVLPFLLIALGVTEIVIAIMDIKIPVILTFMLAVIFILSGVKILLDYYKRNQ